jgi:hypothetical protein
MIPPALSVLTESPPVASASPATREWLIELLRRGERATGQAPHVEPTRAHPRRRRSAARPKVAEGI